jgi:hypothetical protein
MRAAFALPLWAVPEVQPVGGKSTVARLRRDCAFTALRFRRLRFFRLRILICNAVKNVDFLPAMEYY